MSLFCFEREGGRKKGNVEEVGKFGREEGESKGDFDTDRGVEE